nr:hypothetical protein [Tanacetum cinerariifolium]
MANISKDIQCAGSDTRPPMLDRTDFASWKQQIRLYCWGKENGVNILKSIDEGPFLIGTVREPLAEGTKGAPHLGPECPRIYSDLSPEEKDWNIKMTMSRMQLNSKFVNNMLPEWGRFVIAVKLNRGLWDSNYDQLVGNADLGQERHVKCYNCNSTWHIARNYTQLKRPQNFKYYKDKMLLMQAQENGVALDAEQLLFLAGGHDNAIDNDVDEQPVHDLVLNMDNVFKADDYDVFDYDVDEAPTAQTMFMANLSSADPVTDEAGPSYDSDILSELQDHDHYQDLFVHIMKNTRCMTMYNSTTLLTHMLIIRVMVI